MQPKLLPLVAPIGARYQSLSVDPRLVNAFAEKGQAEDEVFVYKRPAFKLAHNTAAATARGLYNWNGNIYAITGGTLYKNGVSLGGIVNSGVYHFVPCLGATPKLFFKNTTNAYTVDAADVIAAVVDPDYPASTVPGTVYLDGTTYVFDSAKAQIYGSTGAANDPTAWDPLNLIRAQIEATEGVALAKHLVYAVALKRRYTEVFYDAGNAAGSPLAPVQGSKMNYGCVDGDSVCDVGGDLIWVAESGEGYPCIAHVSSLKLDIISTPPIERLLALHSGTYYSWAVRVEGHRLYGLTSTGGNFTIVYDLTTKLWYQWTNAAGNYVPYAFSCPGTGTGLARLFLHESNGQVCSLDIGTFKDVGETPFQVGIYTPNYDMGTRLIKVLTNMSLVGDQVTGTSVTMNYSDNDYVTWSADHTFDMGLDRPTLFDLGPFTKRAFRFFHQADTIFRCKAVELYVSAGTAP
jgi:hypothetical protein